VPGPGLPVILREWGRIGCLGFGGPPTHIAMLRETVVERRGWLNAREFEDAVAACNLLPGPASTQLAIFCAWRVRGAIGALAGGAAFILPGLVLIVALAALFLGSPPDWVRGAGAGAGAAVAAVAVHAGWGLVPASRERARSWRWFAYVIAGFAAAATVGPWLVLVLLACGAAELGLRGTAVVVAPLATAITGGLAWTALKVGALSYGGGFVIIPLMRADAVGAYGWMTATEFANAVAYGQLTPGPVVHTVAIVGWAAAGFGGAMLATAIGFLPSFLMVWLFGDRFVMIRGSRPARAFLDGAGPAAVGAILGAAVPLAEALEEPWQFAVLACAATALLLRRGPFWVLVGGAAAGLGAAAVGLVVP
jgi:chromate transporter